MTLVGIAALYEQCDQHEAALELLAILLHHPQRGGDSERKARVLLAQVQARLPAEYVNGVMEQAKQGQLTSSYLDPQFTVDTELIDRLVRLVEVVAKACTTGKAEDE